MANPCIVVARAVETDSDGRTVPTLPAGWEITVHNARWCTVYPQGRAKGLPRFHAWRGAEGGGFGGFVCWGAPAVLRALYQASPHAWTVAELQADSGSVAVALKAAWIDDRRQEFDGNGTPIPRAQWTAPIVGLRQTIAGYAMPADLEATEELP